MNKQIKIYMYRRHPERKSILECMFTVLWTVRNLCIARCTRYAFQCILFLLVLIATPNLKDYKHVIDGTKETARGIEHLDGPVHRFSLYLDGRGHMPDDSAPEVEFIMLCIFPSLQGGSLPWADISLVPLGQAVLTIVRGALISKYCSLQGNWVTNHIIIDVLVWYDKLNRLRTMTCSMNILWCNSKGQVSSPLQEESPCNFIHETVCCRCFTFSYECCLNSCLRCFIRKCRTACCPRHTFQCAHWNLSVREKCKDPERDLGETREMTSYTEGTSGPEQFSASYPGCAGTTAPRMHIGARDVEPLLHDGITSSPQDGSLTPADISLVPLGHAVLVITRGALLSPYCDLPDEGFTKCIIIEMTLWCSQYSRTEVYLVLDPPLGVVVACALNISMLLKSVSKWITLYKYTRRFHIFELYLKIYGSCFYNYKRESMLCIYVCNSLKHALIDFTFYFYPFTCCDPMRSDRECVVCTFDHVLRPHNPAAFLNCSLQKTSGSIGRCWEAVDMRTAGVRPKGSIQSWSATTSLIRGYEELCTLYPVCAYETTGLSLSYPTQDPGGMWLHIPIVLMSDPSMWMNSAYRRPTQDRPDASIYARPMNFIGDNARMSLFRLCDVYIGQSDEKLYIYDDKMYDVNVPGQMNVRMSVFIVCFVYIRQFTDAISIYNEMTNMNFPGHINVRMIVLMLYAVYIGRYDDEMFIYDDDDEISIHDDEILCIFNSVDCGHFNTYGLDE